MGEHFHRGPGRHVPPHDSSGVTALSNPDPPRHTPGWTYIHWNRAGARRNLLKIFLIMTTTILTGMYSSAKILGKNPLEIKHYETYYIARRTFLQFWLAFFNDKVVTSNEVYYCIVLVCDTEMARERGWVQDLIRNLDLSRYITLAIKIEWMAAKGWKRGGKGHTSGKRFTDRGKHGDWNWNSCYLC